MTLEEDALASWLVDFLEADTELMGMLGGYGTEAVYQTGAVPTRASGPFVRADFLDGDDLMVIGLHRVWVNSIWHIRGCVHWEGTGRPDRTDVDAIGARLDALLHDQETQTATHSVHSFREEPEPNPITNETREGATEVWLQSGGVYRLRCYAI